MNLEQMTQIVNQVRCTPSQFITKLKTILDEFFCGVDLVRTRSNGTRVQTMEGVAPVLEAIRYLRTATPRSPLQLNVNLCKAAQLHLEDLDTRYPDEPSHIGLDSSTPGERIRRFVNWKGAVGENIALGESDAVEIIAQFIVDDGVDSRTHRSVLMDRSFNYFGVSFSPKEPFYCVMTFAQDLVFGET